jgi:hypothetical protein
MDVQRHSLAAENRGDASFRFGMEALRSLAWGVGGGAIGEPQARPLKGKTALESEGMSRSETVVVFLTTAAMEPSDRRGTALLVRE